MRQQMSFCRCWLAIVVLHFISRSNFFELANDTQRENCTNTPYIISLNSTNSVERQNSVLLTAVYTLPRMKTSALNFTTTWSAANLDNVTVTPRYCDIATGRSNASLRISTVEFAYHSDNLCVLNVSANLHSIDECTEMQQLTVWFSGFSLNVAFKFSLSFRMPAQVFHAKSKNGNQTKQYFSKPVETVTEKRLQVCRHKTIPPSNIYLSVSLPTTDNAPSGSSGSDHQGAVDASTVLSTLAAYVVSCRATALPAPQLRLSAIFADGAPLPLEALSDVNLRIASETRPEANSSIRPCPSGKVSLENATRALLDLPSLLGNENASHRLRAQVAAAPRILLRCVADISERGSRPEAVSQRFDLAELPPPKLSRQAWMSIEGRSDAEMPRAVYRDLGYGQQRILSMVFFETDNAVLTCRIRNAPWHSPLIFKLSDYLADAEFDNSIWPCPRGESNQTIALGIGTSVASTVIRSLKMADTGLYRCCARLSSTAGSRPNQTVPASTVSSAAYLPVAEVYDDAALEVASATAPIFANPNSTMLVLLEGSALLWPCEVIQNEDVPTLAKTFEWFKDGVRINIASNLSSGAGGLDGDKNDSLWLAHVSLADSGDFVCLVSNRFGSSNKTFTVRVFSREIDVPPNNSLQQILGGTFGSILAIALALAALVLCKKRKFLRLRNNGRLIDDKTDAVFLTSDLQQLLIERKLIINRKRLIIGESIGSGNFSQVYRGHLRPRKGHSSSKRKDSQLIEVAIKTPSNKSDADELRYMVAELEILAKVGTHRNILRLHGALISHSGSNTGISIVTEYCCNGSLDSFLLSHRYDFQASNCPDGTLIDDARPDQLSTGHLLLISYQAASGLNYLSLQNIIHRDIAARNVLIAEGLTVKIADFGLSKTSLTKYTSGTRSQNQPLPWLAIESITDAVFSKESDVWSFGVLLWEIFSLGSVPFADTLICGHFDEYLAAGHRLARPALASIELYQLMSSCWDISPKKRPTFSACMSYLHELGVAKFPKLFESSIRGSDVQNKPKAMTSSYVSCGVRSVLDTRL